MRIDSPISSDKIRDSHPPSIVSLGNFFPLHSVIDFLKLFCYFVLLIDFYSRWNRFKQRQIVFLSSGKFIILFSKRILLSSIRTRDRGIVCQQIFLDHRAILSIVLLILLNRAYVFTLAWELSLPRITSLETWISTFTTKMRLIWFLNCF